MAKQTDTPITIMDREPGSMNGPTPPPYMKSWKTFKKSITNGDYVRVHIRSLQGTEWILRKLEGFIAEVGSHALFISGLTASKFSSGLEVKVKKSEFFNPKSLIGIPYFTIHNWEIIPEEEVFNLDV